MSDFESFLETQNFKLAWQRILRSRHYHNKDRIGLKVYQANLDVNLEFLIDALRQKTYKPSLCEKIYIPKRAGTLRSFPVLSIQDRLVYQAIVNIVANNSKSSFEAIVGGYVFAHLLSDLNSEFMLRRWDGPTGQYRKFLKTFQEKWEGGDNRWLVHADIASYYDSIDHGLLRASIMKNNWLDSDDLVDVLINCLHEWTGHDEDGANFSRGLPQGYEASDYLATLFLLPTDEQMIKQRPNYYIRYADDIRIFTPSRDIARRSLLELDVALKKQALILQPTKTGAREIVDIKDELDKLGNTLSMIDQKRRKEEDIDEEAEELFFKSWDAFKEDETAEAHLIFALHRIPPSIPAGKIAQQLLSVMPWRADSITGYLAEFEGDLEVVETLLAELKNHRIYAWYLACCLQALSRIAEVEKYKSICYEWIKDKNKSIRWYQRLAAVESLQKDEGSYSFLFLAYKSESNFFVRRGLLVGAANAAPTDSQRALVIRTGLKDKDPLIVATSVWLFLEFPNCGINENEFDSTIGIHKKMIPAFSGIALLNVCYIKETLSNRFKVVIPDDLDFRLVFGTAYDQAVEHLRRILRSDNIDPTMCITSLDNFNQIIAISLNEVFTIQPNIPRDQYGNLLKAGPFVKDYGEIAVHFFNCHEIRSSSRGAHAWATSLGAWSQDVTHKQKEQLIEKLRISYQCFVDKFARHQGLVP
ncbi:MAG: hypothetical protein HXX20_16720 [Chloroflexi bacterium]|nr:hypothetical protein [Chloroflexota bacterium]